MTYNDIFDLYGNKLPTKSYRVFDGDIVEWDFAIDPKKDDFDLIAKGIACDWSMILENGSWTEAIISRDRIKRELEKEADAIIYREIVRGQEAKDWMIFGKWTPDPPNDIYTDTYYIKFNQHGQITERKSSWYKSETSYYEIEGRSYVYEHNNSFGIHVKYDHKAGRLVWLQGKPKLPKYAERST